MKRAFLMVLLAAAALWPVSAMAVPIPGLFNTGVDAAGVPLVGSGVIDPHYVILSGPAGSVTFPSNAVTFNCCYFADFPAGTNGPSRWVSVNSGGASASSGSYLFDLTFSLAGLDPATASISGQFAADNLLTATSINGNVVPGATAPGFSTYTNFTIPVGSGFIPGVNHLSFLVQDQGAPMSLRVNNLAGIAELAPTGPNVPEPSSLLLLGLGLTALGGLARRRSKAA